MANTLVNAISIPKNIPPIADNISPIVGAVNIPEKSQPFPHNTNEPIRHAKAANIADHDGFSLTRINIVRGTAIQDMLSKNVFFAGDVQSGASLVVRAMASGHAAAESVDAYFRKPKK